MSALTICRDCGIDAWNFLENGHRVHEDFYVHNALWDEVCPDDLVEEVAMADGKVARQGSYVLCIGCFENRLGRELNEQDFKPGQDPNGWYWKDLVGCPASERFMSRLAA